MLDIFKKKDIQETDNCWSNFNSDEFWRDSEYALKEYVLEYPTDKIIKKVEKKIRYKLPKSYITFMRLHNGGIPFDCSYPTTEPTSWAKDHIAIEGIYGIGLDKAYSLGGSMGSRFWIKEWEYPDIGVAICDCPSAGHDMIFLDYRACGKNGEPCVVHIDQEIDYTITKLADSFEEFIKGLVNTEYYENK